MAVFILDFGIEDKLLIIVGAAFGVTERHRAEYIWKKRHGDAQNRAGGTEKCKESQSETEQYIEAHISDSNHGAAHIKIEWHTQKGESQILAEEIQASRIRMVWCEMTEAATRDGTK